MQPSTCWRRPSGLTTSPHVHGTDHALDLHVAGAPVDRDLRHGGDVRVGVDAAGDADAPPAGRLCRPSSRTCRAAASSTRRMRGVGEVIQAELQRVDAGLGRQDIHVRFAREGVGVDRGRAPRAHGERVHAGRVAALPSAGRDRALVGDVVVRSSPRAHRRRPPGVPERDLSGARHARADLHHGRRTEAIVEELFGAVPDHLNRLAGGFRQPRRFHGLRAELLPPKPPPT